MSRRILLVEDDPNLGFVMKDNLIQKGFNVTLCGDGEEGWRAFHQGMFDLCILDIMLPKRDGFTLARNIRETNMGIPILFVTAKTMLEDKIEGFSSGGDDYIVKPFSMDELCLRMEVFLRRTGGPLRMEEKFSVGGFTFDTQTLTLLHRDGKKVLTEKEADVLRLLCLHQDRVLKREEILKSVWGNDDYFLGRSLDVFISKLRKYMKEDPSVEIVNYHGVGFRMEIKSLQRGT